MKRHLFLAIALISLFSQTSHATIVVVSTTRFAPTVTTTRGELVEGGLVRVGSITAEPAGSTIGDIERVFREFGTSTTRAGGLFGATLSNLSASEFDDEQIYVWLLDAPTLGESTEHAFFSVSNPDPVNGDPWVFPTHIGNGIDLVTIAIREFFTNGDPSFTPEMQFTNLGLQNQNITLARSEPIPEPSTAPLAGLSTAILFLRRRRP